MKKSLEALLGSLIGCRVFGPTNLQVLGIIDDSRQVKKGFLFVAIKGLTANGHLFIDQAIKNGARVIVGEDDRQNNNKVTYIKVEDSREALGYLCAAWYDNPSLKLKVIGVTGTDGKTTTASLIWWLLKKAGKKVGLVSTIGAKIGDRSFETGLHMTNPEPPLLQSFLAKMVKLGCEYAVLEVTSHGLDQKRVAGIDFDTGVLTNITHEHLDYHKTFVDYQKAKAKLFAKAKVAILNQDDQSFTMMVKAVPSSSQIFSYGVNSQSVDFGAKDIIVKGDQTQFKLSNGQDNFRIKTSLLGKYNVYNVLAAVACARFLKISWLSIISSLASFKPLTGRLEKIKSQDFGVYVDFAHTPNALKNVLSMLKEKAQGRLIVVFGCAGERDREKRFLMGEIAAQIADLAVFTAEDPRHEDVNLIIKSMVEGALKTGAKELANLQDLKSGKQHYFLSIKERGEAIYWAINKLAQKDDLVVICGKGHEKSMAYDGVEYPWSDQEAAKEALKGRMKTIKRHGC